MKILLILLISTIVMIKSFTIHHHIPNNNIMKATNTNRDDLSDKDFKEIFGLSKTVQDDTKSITKTKKTSGMKWNDVLGPGKL